MSHRNIKQAAHGLTKPHWTDIIYKKLFMTEHNRLDWCHHSIHRK